MSQPCIHEAINASGKLVQVLVLSGACKLKAWLEKSVIGLAGGENATPRLGLQAYRNRGFCRGERRQIVGSEVLEVKRYVLYFFLPCFCEQLVCDNPGKWKMATLVTCDRHTSLLA